MQKLGGSKIMTDFIYEDAFEPDVCIKVIGVGGAGGNALNCMVQSGVQNIEYIAVNTDAKALNNSKANTRIQIGAKLTRGRGAGNKPEIGASSAEENSEEIEAALKGADMIFITAGMGGGTGTGAAPVVARIAKDAGILTVAVVTKPFAFEREQKMAQAEKGISELRKYVDSLIVIPNEKLLEGDDKPLTMRESFARSDDILEKGVRSISDLIVEEGYINLDFADITTIMRGAGYAHMAIGHGSGKDKAKVAAAEVIASPLLETSIAGAKRLLINITMSEDVLSSDVDTATKLITEKAAENVESIFGTAFKSDMHDEMTITVIATGFGDVDEPENEAVEAEVETEKAPAVEAVQPKAPEVKVNPAPKARPSVQAAQPASEQSASKEPLLNDEEWDTIFKILDER